MKGNLIKEIIDKKFDCIIVSPHHDDAVLSCAELLAQLKGKTAITVINVFTSTHGKPYTLSQKQFLKASTNADALALYEERENEDKKVLSQLGVSIINLDFKDALFRKKKQSTFLGKLLPEFDHVYPTYRWHLLKGLSKNDTSVKDLKKKLLRYKNKKTLIFAPYAIGDHIDHLIVRKVCEELFDNLVLYSDFPYNVRLGSDGKVLDGGKVYTLTPDYIKKSAFIKGYKTQFDGLFSNGIIPKHDELYFIKKQL